MMWRKMVSLILMVMLIPICFPIAIVQLMVFGKVFFRQIRIGKNEKPFRIYKFQTLRSRQSGESDVDRLMTWGYWLRRFSLDEIPQLINIFKGEMAFIGPRPLLPEYLELYNSEQRLRHKVLPGLTGWAQVHGRNALSWHDQFKLDIWYVENNNLLIDLKILVLTMGRFFSRGKESTLREAFNGEN